MLRAFRERRQERKALDTLKTMLAGEWVCSCCGEIMTGLQDIAFDAPGPWPHAAKYAPNSELKLEGDFLSSDFCVMGGEHFFVRSVMLFPVKGIKHTLGVGVWSSLSRENFKEFVDGFDDPEANVGSEYFSWLVNTLEPLDMQAPTRTHIVTQPNRQRPLVEADSDSEMGHMQAYGLSASQTLAAIGCGGHAPSLT